MKSFMICTLRQVLLEEIRRGDNRNSFRLLVEKPEGRRPLERPRHRWLDNIRMDLVKIRWCDVD
jgi:hypothetical protein